MKIGLIAGNGIFPIFFAENAIKKGYQVYAVAHKNNTEKNIEKVVKEISWVRVGQISSIIKFFKKHEIKKLVMLGGIIKTRAFIDMMPDAKCLSVLKQIKNDTGDDKILRAFADLLEKEGFEVLPSYFVTPDILAKKGLWTKRAPTEEEEKDIKIGYKIAKEIGRLDIGQCVVVHRASVLAVEAIEGTDAAILRGGSLSKNGSVLVKVSKPKQDLRFDLPSVGIKTLQTMKEANVNVLVIEAEKTIVFNKDEIVDFANKNKISVVVI